MLALRNFAYGADPVEEFLQVLDLVEQVARAPRGRDALLSVMRYFFAVAGREAKELRTALEPKVSRVVAMKMKTAADYLREEGYTAGHADGVLEGHLQGQAELVLSQLIEKFGDVPVRTRRRVRRASQAELARLAKRVLSARTMREVLGPFPTRKRRAACFISYV